MNYVEEAQSELTEKLTWIFGDAPYLFGYATAGLDARIYAITPTQDNKTTTHLLGTYDCNDIADRFRLLLALLNISRLSRCITKLCPPAVGCKIEK